LDFDSPMGGGITQQGLWVPNSMVEQKSDRSITRLPASRSGNFSGILQDAAKAENRFKDLNSYQHAVKIVPWVFAAISVIAYNYAKGPWHLWDGGPEGTEVTDPSDPFLRLWNRPNKRMTGFQFRELSQFYVYLCGEYFVTLENWDVSENIPTEMYLPNPARMRVVQDQMGDVAGYVYDPSGTGTFQAAGSLIPYEAWEVVHVKMANPLDQLRGMGVIEAMEPLMNTMAAMTNTELSYWQSGGRIIGVLQTDNPVDDETFNKLVRRWREFTAQKQQRFKTAILEQGLKYQPIAEGLKGIDLTAIDKAKRDQVLGTIGVPKNKLGIIEDAQYKSDEADRFFWSETMEPLFTRNEDGLQPLPELFNPDYLIMAERKNFEDDTVKLNNAKIMQALGFTIGEVFQYLGVDEPADKRKDMVVFVAGTAAIPVDQLGEPPPAPAAPARPALPPGERPLTGAQASATNSENGRSNRVDETGHKPNQPQSVVKMVLETLDVKMLEHLNENERAELVDYYAEQIIATRTVIKSRRLIEYRGLNKLNAPEAKAARIPRLPAHRHAASLPGSGELVRRTSTSARSRLVPRHKPEIAAAFRSQRRRLTPILKDFIETFKAEVSKKEPHLRERQRRWLRERWPTEPLAEALRGLHAEAANDGWRAGKRALGFKP
jgi:HK97 family phage portal protein